jgi:hypothetical protein
MGGEGTMARWSRAVPRLVSADLIHPSGNGGKIIATLLTEELLAGLDRFKIKQGSETPDLVMAMSPARKAPGSTPRDTATVDMRPISPPTPARNAATPTSAEKGGSQEKGSARAETRNLSHLRGKGAIIVLAEERSVSQELLAHPENLRQFIQSGLLFGVNNGTGVEIIDAQGDSIRVIVAEGQMRGRSGWIPSQLVERLRHPVPKQ